MKEQIIYKKVSELKNNPNNPRKNDVAVDSVAKSIEKYGFRNPLIIDEDNIVWCGNTRLKASRKLGLEEVPCIVINDLTEKQMRELALLDNKTNEIAEWDFDLLSEELADLDLGEFDLDWGIDEKLGTEKEVVEDDFDCTPPEEPKAKLGDIYQLGNHRLMCGDSTKEEDVEKLMNGNKADMVFTDPPYNVDYSNAERPKASKTDLGRIKNDTMSEDDFIYFLGEVYKRLDENTKDNSSFYIWYASKETIAFYSALLETNIKVNQQIIWKKPMLLGRGKYQWAHEPCMFAIKGSPYFTDDRTKTTVWDFGGYDKSKNVHPTQKPLFLPTEAINNSSIKGNIVLDLFGGSGSTLIACEPLNRNCYMMELDPKYVDVIIARWEQFTGKKAEKVC